MEAVERRVSVIVPTYNRRASLCRLLDGLASQTDPAAALEVLVVDDGSTDDTVRAVQDRETPRGLRLLSQSNAGPGAARNLGAAHASGDLLLFLDDDVVPEPALIAEHMSAHEGREDTVVIGPMLPPAGWSRPAWIRWEEDKLLRQYHAMQAGEWECSARQFYTGNASLPRALFERAGGFDVAFRRAEDVELAYRLRRLGARFVFRPEAAALHYPTRSLEAWKRTPYQYGRYDVVMQRKGEHGTLDNATREFHLRHPYNRTLARLCVGRPAALRGATAALELLARALDTAGAQSAASAALSALFNLLYWQGAADELGGAAALWQAIEAARTTAPPARALAPGEV